METSAVAQPAEQEAAQESKKGNTFAGFAPLADSLSKAVAAIAIALYASGFLIVSLHHSKFGFITTDPFRPRILAAGAWFFLFAGIPIVAAFEYRMSTWTHIARNAFFFWSFAFGLSIPFMIVFDFENSLALTGWELTGAISGFAIITVIALKHAKFPRWAGAIASVLITILLVALEVWRMEHNDFSLNTLTVWFFGIFAFTLVQLKTFEQTGMKTDNWSRPLPVVLTAIFLFARSYYPHLKSSWGGGTPTKATIYFTKDSIIKPSQAVSARLIEESDQGFYIAAPNEEKAIFVPRSNVSLIYFGENAKDSALLK